MEATKAGTARAEARFVLCIIVPSGNFRAIRGNLPENQNDLGGYKSAIVLPIIPAEMTGARESGAMTDDEETASCSARSGPMDGPLGRMTGSQSYRLSPD
jgi:hypothetical protein